MTTITLDTAKIVQNWRTTANGLISAGIAVLVAVMALPPGARHATYVLAGLRALVGFLQVDAGKTPAQTPDGEVKLVDSHEVPNDVANVPVKQ